jgi:sporulation related protein
MLRRGRDEPDADERSAVRRDAVDDDYLDDDDLEALEDLEEPRSFFERGWVRAVLVLAALAVVLVVSLPYLMRWIDLSPPPAPRQAAERPTPTPAVPAPVTQAAPIAPATTPVTPAAPAPPEKAESAAPPVSPAPAPPAAATGGTQAATSVSDGAAAAARGKGDYWVQVGAFGDAKNAERLAAKLRDAKMPVEVTRADRSTTPHVVRAGAYPTRAEAEAALKELRATGVTGFVAEGAPR